MEGRTGRHDVARRPCHCGFRSPAFSQQLEWTGHGVAGARAGPQGLAAAQRDTLLRVPRGCGGLPRRPRLPLCGAPFPARSLLSWAGGRLPTRRCDRGPRAPAGSGGSDQAEAQALGPQTRRAGRRVCPQDDRGRGLVRRPCSPALAAPGMAHAARGAPRGFRRARRVLSVRVPAVGTQAEASVALTRDAASFRRGPLGAQPGPHGVGAGLRAQETESEEKGAPAPRGGTAVPGRAAGAASPSVSVPPAFIAVGTKRRRKDPEEGLTYPSETLSACLVKVRVFTWARVCTHLFPYS